MHPGFYWDWFVIVAPDKIELGTWPAVEEVFRTVAEPRDSEKVFCLLVVEHCGGL